jgi:hypothetical protein
VVRNPFDSIATASRRTGKSLEVSASRFFRLCSTVAEIRSGPTAVLDLRHEELVTDARGQLRRVLGWLGLDEQTEYVEACAATVFDNPHRTRHEVVWREEVLTRVEAATRSYDFLAGYTMES